MSQWQIGRKLSEETCSKISKSNIGRKMGDDHKNKIRETHSKKYTILNTDTGEIFKIFNMRKFRLENNIGRGIANGRCGKFRIIKIIEKVRQISIFNEITNENIIVENLNKFCKEKNIFPGVLKKSFQLNSFRLNKEISKGYKIVKIEEFERIKLKKWNDLTIIVDF